MEQVLDSLWELSFTCPVSDSQRRSLIQKTWTWALLALPFFSPGLLLTLYSSHSNSTDEPEPGHPISWMNHSQFSSVAQLCPGLCDPVDCNMPGFPVHPQLLKFAQIHVHQVSDAIQPSHPLSSPSPPALNLSQHQGLFQWVSSSRPVAKVLEFQLQHQSF